MSYNKNTIVGQVLTSKPLSLLVEAIPYAIVHGNGCNDDGHAAYVLCYADIKGETYADVRDQTEDCDFNDHIRCEPVRADRSVAYDRMWPSNGEKARPVARAKLKPLSELFLVRSTSHSFVSSLHADRAEAQEVLASRRGDYPGHDWEIVTLSAAEVLAYLENARFKGI